MGFSKRSFIEGLCLGFSITLFFLWRLQREKKTKKNIPLNSLNPGDVEEARKIDAEQLVRTQQFYGQKGLDRVRSAFVVVVGVGGVGSHCAIALARSGIGHLKLIDFDQVSLSSLNRHACATRVHVGLPKVDVLKIVIKDIFPSILIETERACFNINEASNLLMSEGQKPDFVIDCIDNIQSKVDLITYCYHAKIPWISSGGSGGRSDPTKIRIDDLSAAVDDPLCSTIRTLLRKRGIDTGCMMCYSTEKGAKKLLPLEKIQQSNVDDYRLLKNFRVRVIPVIGPLPAIFGNALASYVLGEVIAQPIPDLNHSTQEAIAEMRLSSRNYKQLFDCLKQVYNIHGLLKSANVKNLQLSYRKTRWLYVKIYKGCCVISHCRLKPRALQLVPWRCINNSLIDSLHAERNVICLKQELAKRHLKTFALNGNGENSTLPIEDIWDADTIQRIDHMLANQVKMLLSVSPQLLMDQEPYPNERFSDVTSVMEDSKNATLHVHLVDKFSLSLNIYGLTVFIELYISAQPSI